MSTRTTTTLALLSLVSVAARADVPKALVCAVDKGVAVARAPGNPEARRAAQRGLEYLAHASEQWTSQHQCFGCHVQAVTLEALTVGKHHQYDVQQGDLDAMVRALQMGVTAGGHATGVAFQGQAWARYDQWIDGAHQGDLVRYATELIRLQAQDGASADDDARLPVTGGVMHTTYQAMQTWRQAYARTADDKWLAPMRLAEKYLASRAAGFDDKTYLQDVNLALLGLTAAGVGSSEEPSRRLQKLLLARQNQDGGWALDGAGARSDAFATGQTLYALKLAGHTDVESAIARGVQFLVDKQGKDGAWRTYASHQGGSEKGEGMWAVLGLVSTDVMSIAVSGVTDGQHVEPTMNIAVLAKDNSAGGVQKIELFVDDLPLDGKCADRIEVAWPTRGLVDGKHTLDVVATNSKGQVSRRRFDVYAGKVYLTEIGARFDEARQTTDVTVRDIAARPGKLELDVYAVDAKTNKRGKKVYTTAQQAGSGAMTFAVGGKDVPRGRYEAELVLRDDRGAVVQKESTLFFHESETLENQQYGQIEGRLAMHGGLGIAANSTVELVDAKGDVVQRVQSNEQGNYRFKGVAAGHYKVRATKRGWSSQESAVTSAPAAAPARADMHF